MSSKLYVLIAMLSLIVLGACAPQAPVEVVSESPVTQEVEWGKDFVYFPDGGITFLEGRVYGAWGPQGLEYHGTGYSFVTQPSAKDQSFDENYSAPGAVVQVEGEYVMFTHNEQWPCSGHFPFRASVGIAFSNNGIEFSDAVQILEGHSEMPPCTENRVSGNGYPTAVVSGQYIYLYFVSWGEGADAVHVARCLVTDIHENDCWRKYNDGNWDQPGMGGSSTPVVGRRSESDIYLATPQIQWYGERLVGVFESNLGFLVSYSSDGVSWSEPQMLFEFPEPHIGATGANWFSYPTLHQEGEVWWLYMARGSELGFSLHRTQVTLP